MTITERINSIARSVWLWTLNDQQRIEQVRNALLDAKRTSQVNDIVMSNLEFVDRMGLWRLANLAKRRINNLNKVKRELTELKYMN